MSGKQKIKHFTIRASLTITASGFTWVLVLIFKTSLLHISTLKTLSNSLIFSEFVVIHLRHFIQRTWSDICLSYTDESYSFNRAIQTSWHSLHLSFLFLILGLDQMHREHYGINLAEQKLLSKQVSSRETPYRSWRLRKNSCSLLLR